jgi:hypothetical protein
MHAVRLHLIAHEMPTRCTNSVSRSLLRVQRRTDSWGFTRPSPHWYRLLLWDRLYSSPSFSRALCSSLS